MNFVEEIVTTLIAVHLITVLCFFLLKNTNVLEKLRSSNAHPANQGATAVQIGGLIVVPITLLAVIYFLNSLLDLSIAVQLIISLSVLVLFIVGFIDDYKPISAVMRLTIHFASATSITIIIFQLTNFSGIAELTAFTGILLPSFAISWMINATNFIDGMDLFVVISIFPGVVLFSLLHFITTDEFIMLSIFSIFIFSLLGFVWFNWPQASVYMGDAGTLSIGFLISACGVYILAKYGSISGFIPFAYMLVDTTFTLLKRIITGSNPFKSHNQHAYPFLAYLCFEYGNVLFWQFTLGLCAFIFSLGLFVFLKKARPV